MGRGRIHMSDIHLPRDVDTELFECSEELLKNAYRGGKSLEFFFLLPLKDKCENLSSRIKEWSRSDFLRQ